MYELPKTNKSIFRDAKGFERSQRILEALGNPQNTHKAIHVAGTSGKGSVCYQIEAILQAHGKKTALMVSPHVYDIRERIQINGSLIGKDTFLRLTNTLLQKLEHFAPSYFEALTCLGFLASAEENIDYLVVETGFGGLWDTTNTITRKDKVCAINQIGYDHTAILGDTLEKIAFQKAGIIQKNGNLIYLNQEAGVNRVVETYAKKQHATVTTVDKNDSYQKTNKSLSLSTAKLLAQRDGWKFDIHLATRAVDEVFIPGRYEKMTHQDHTVVLDGAHNPQKLQALVDRLAHDNLLPATFILAMGERKDWRTCLEILKPAAKRIIATEFFTETSATPHRALSSAQLAEACKEIGITTSNHVAPGDALGAALSFNEPIIVTGSFYLLGEMSLDNTSNKSA